MHPNGSAIPIIGTQIDKRDQGHDRKTRRINVIRSPDPTVFPEIRPDSDYQVESPKPPVDTDVMDGCVCEHIFLEAVNTWQV
jgi:hypothetical protein